MMHKRFSQMLPSERRMSFTCGLNNKEHVWNFQNRWTDFEDFPLHGIVLLFYGSIPLPINTVIRVYVNTERLLTLWTAWRQLKKQRVEFLFRGLNLKWIVLFSQSIMQILLNSFESFLETCTTYLLLREYFLVFSKSWKWYNWTE